MSTLRADNVQSLDGTNKDVKTLLDNQTIVDRINYASDAEFNAAKAGKVSIDSAKRVRMTSAIVGTEEITGATTRDAYVVGRDVIGATDCHGFADRTIMSGVTDAGTYGSFDCTVRLNGNNTQNHIYAFQHRVTYGGSGTLERVAGLLTRPVHAGTGAITESYGADIGTMSITGGGTVSQQVGILIRDQVGASNNVGLNVAQTTGFSIYAPGDGQVYAKGRSGFGIQPNTNFAVQAAGTAVGARRAFIDSTTTAVQFGGEGDGTVQFITNSGLRAQIKALAQGHAFTPGTDNAQNCGDATNRWATVFAGTGAINTSDGTQKNVDPSDWKVRPFTAAELAAASDLAKEIGAFKFLASIAEKGDAAREHIGMTVQRAIQIMESHGLDPFAYSFICFDKWEREVIEHPAEIIEHPATYRTTLVVDGNGMPFEELVSDAYIEVTKDAWTEVVHEAGQLYSFRESGLYAFIAAGQEARIAALEAR